ncbi:MAG: rRNA maturation RNase YbeY [Cyanobacteria bacterium J06554_11]
MENPTAPLQVETFVEGRSLGDVPELEIVHYQHWIQTWLRALAPELSPLNAYEVSLRLTDDTEIQQLNTDYRQQENPTDVLSFAALETPLPVSEALLAQQPLYLGDIIISVDTARRQAQTANHPLTQELAWLAAHGLLHLLGWDHPDDGSLTQMLEQQETLLTLI